MTSNRGIASTNIGDSYYSGGFYEHGRVDELLACRGVWRAVILQSILDIVGNSKRTEDKVEKAFAMQWALEDNEDFYMVCSLAEYRPGYVRDQIVSILKEKKVSRKFIQSMKLRLRSNHRKIIMADSSDDLIQ